MLPFDRRSFLRWMAIGLVASSPGLVQSASPLPTYARALTLGPNKEWRFNPLLIDVNGDGHLDLVATARLANPALHMWLGDGKGSFSPIAPTWSDIGYAALATGDINGDGFPDIVGASHFGAVQTLLSDGKGGFTDKILRREDGYVAAQLADLNGDGHLDLILVGYEKAGIEIYFGDGKGNWQLHNTLPEVRPGHTMPGRALVIGDLNHDGHLDLVAAFQRWGIYIYYGDGRGGFTGGSVDFSSPSREFQSLALGDVNKDGHSDIVINGTVFGRNQPNGPDVYLGDGRVEGPEIWLGRGRARRSRWRREPRYRRCRKHYGGHRGREWSLLVSGGWEGGLVPCSGERVPEQRPIGDSFHHTGRCGSRWTS